MDAQEEDKDVVLQQASSDLIAKFKSSLPKFLWSSRANDGLPSSAQRRKVRRVVRYSTTVDLIKLASLLTRSASRYIAMLIYMTLAGTVSRMAAASRSSPGCFARVLGRRFSLDLVVDKENLSFSSEAHSAFRCGYSASQSNMHVTLHILQNSGPEGDFSILQQ
jgi:hypothetical protein